MWYYSFYSIFPKVESFLFAEEKELMRNSSIQSDGFLRFPHYSIENHVYLDFNLKEHFSIDWKFHRKTWQPSGKCWCWIFIDLFREHQDSQAFFKYSRLVFCLKYQRLWWPGQEWIRLTHSVVSTVFFHTHTMTFVFETQLQCNLFQNQNQMAIKLNTHNSNHTHT